MDILTISLAKKYLKCSERSGQNEKGCQSICVNFNFKWGCNSLNVISDGAVTELQKGKQ